MGSIRHSTTHFVHRYSFVLPISSAQFRFKVQIRLLLLNLAPFDVCYILVECACVSDKYQAWHYVFLKCVQWVLYISFEYGFYCPKDDHVKKVVMWNKLLNKSFIFFCPGKHINQPMDSFSRTISPSLPSDLVFKSHSFSCRESLSPITTCLNLKWSSFSPSTSTRLS